MQIRRYSQPARVSVGPCLRVLVMFSCATGSEGSSSIYYYNEWQYQKFQAIINLVLYEKSYKLFFIGQFLPQ